MANPDGAAARTRKNGVGADLNRDWGPFQQPETRAAMRHALSGLDLVAVVCGREESVRRSEEKTAKPTASTVEQSVADLDGLVHLVGAGGIVHLPQPEANLGHLVAIVERDVWDRHGGRE